MYRQQGEVYLAGLTIPCSLDVSMDISHRENMSLTWFSPEPRVSSTVIFQANEKDREAIERSITDDKMLRSAVRFSTMSSSRKRDIFAGYILVFDIKHCSPMTIELDLSSCRKLNAPLPTEVQWGELRSACSHANWVEAWKIAGVDHDGPAHPAELYLLRESVKWGQCVAALAAFPYPKKMSEFEIRTPSATERMKAIIDAVEGFLLPDEASENQKP